MYLSIARIAPFTGPADVDPEWLAHRLWEHRSAITRVESVRVRAYSNGLRIAAFTVSGDQLESDDKVRRLINLTISCTPEMHQWRLL
jgi:hypothetical protein